MRIHRQRRSFVRSPVGRRGNRTGRVYWFAIGIGASLVYGPLQKLVFNCMFSIRPAIRRATITSSYLINFVWHVVCYLNQFYIACWSTLYNFFVDIKTRFSIPFIIVLIPASFTSFPADQCIAEWPDTTHQLSDELSHAFFVRCCPSSSFQIRLMMYAWLMRLMVWLMCMMGDWCAWWTIDVHDGRLMCMKGDYWCDCCADNVIDDVIFNQSIICSTVPAQWKRAYIRPVNKIAVPKVPVDFRPISITPVLSRMMEKMIVRTFIYPALLCPPPALCFTDQFAFRPTGSTTAAIISLQHTVTNLLASNQYVIVYCLDFSKAFDTVRHSTLMEKIAMLQLPRLGVQLDGGFLRAPQTSSSVWWRMVRIPGNSGKHHPGLRNWPYILCCQRWRSENEASAEQAGEVRRRHLPHRPIIYGRNKNGRRFPTSASGQQGIISLWTIPRPSKLSSQDQEVDVQSHHPPWSLESYVQSRWKMLGVTISSTFSVSQHIDETVSTCVSCIVCSQNSSSAWTEHRTASITCSSLLSSPGYCTHLLLGGGFTNASDRERPWGSLEEKHSIGFLLGKTHHHSPPSVKSLTMICSRRFAPIIHMFCTVSCRRNLHVYTLCENDTIILFCLTIPSHSWIAISSIEFYIKTPML